MSVVVHVVLKNAHSKLVSSKLAVSPAVADNVSRVGAARAYRSVFAHGCAGSDQRSVPRWAGTLCWFQRDLRSTALRWNEVRVCAGRGGCASHPTRLASNVVLCAGRTHRGTRTSLCRLATQLGAWRKSCRL